MWKSISFWKMRRYTAKKNCLWRAIRIHRSLYGSLWGYTLRKLFKHGATINGFISYNLSSSDILKCIQSEKYFDEMIWQFCTIVVWQLKLKTIYYQKYEFYPFWPNNLASKIDAPHPHIVINFSIFCRLGHVYTNPVN